MTAEDIRANHVRQMHDVGCTGESISRMLVNWSRPKRTWYESCHSLAHERVYTMIHHVGKCRIPPFTFTSQTPSRNASRITRYPAIIATNGNRMTIETPRYNEFDYQSSAIGYNAAPTTTLNDISYNMCMRDFAADTATRIRRLVGVVGSRVSIAELGHKAIDSGVVGSVRVCA